MSTHKNTKVLLSRPKDDTLDSFKEWILELAEHMGIVISEEERNDTAMWQSRWEKYKSGEKNDADGK